MEQWLIVVELDYRDAHLVGLVLILMTVALNKFNVFKQQFLLKFFDL